VGNVITIDDTNQYGGIKIHKLFIHQSPTYENLHLKIKITLLQVEMLYQLGRLG